MLYILAILLPPLAVLFTGKGGQVILNIILTLIGWVPGVVHAFIVINNDKQDKRHTEMLRNINRI